jgi:ankyrin repeat protein
MPFRLRGISLSRHFQHHLFKENTKQLRQFFRAAVLPVAASSGLVAAANVTVENDRSSLQPLVKSNWALHCAAKDNDTESVIALLQAGAKADAKNEYGITPLRIAAGENAAEAIAILLQAGAKVNVKDKYGITPLHDAAKQDNTDSIVILLESGAGVNVKNNIGDTPLHAAAKKNNTKSVAILVEAGANVNAKNNNGDTPLQLLENSIADALSILRKTSFTETGSLFSCFAKTRELFL